jgi:hypothetical protein
MFKPPVIWLLAVFVVASAAPGLALLASHLVPLVLVVAVVVGVLRVVWFYTQR